MLAKINGVFRLTRDAELSYTQAGMAIVKLGLACSEKFKEKETTLFVDATAFSKPAELINQYAGRKGMQISLSGKLQTDQWVDQNQQKRSKISMVIESFEFLPNIDKDSQSYSPTNHNVNNPQQNTHANQNREQPKSNTVPEIDIDSDDIPF